MRRLIYFLARFTAVIGGLVLMALVLMTTASIEGRPSEDHILRAALTDSLDSKPESKNAALSPAIR